LAKLSGYYFSRMPADVAEKLLADWNEKNTPPIPEPEFKAQVSDFARRYKSGEYKSKYTESSAPIDLEEDDIPLLPVNVNHFLDASSPEINWLVQNVIPYETSTIIGGMQGIGKSWALLDLAVEAAKGGGKWFNYLPVNKAKVLYIDEESHENLLRFRLKKIVGGKGIQGQHLDLDFAVGQGFSFTNPKKLSQFKELLRQLKPELIIMDSLIMFHGLDENLAKDMRYLFKIVKRIVDEYKVTFVFADHEGKGNPKDKGFQASHRLRGSSAKGDAADTVLSMSKRDMHLYVEHTKARYFKALPKFVVGINDLSPQATVVECLGLGGDS
ncbi:MAG: AAA family ATPase, partial [Candidatus Peribacteraceae bacterium]|nr:AAA family ATPase [Candidatus Peribacteraceae bacterium]